MKKCATKWGYDNHPDLTLRRIAVDKESAHLIGALLTLSDTDLIKIDLREAGLEHDSITAVCKGEGHESTHYTTLHQLTQRFDEDPTIGTTLRRTQPALR